MRIVVCVKNVPDTESERRFESGVLVRGADDILNELDENALETAVSAVEDFGGEVIALCVGPSDSTNALTRALQLGADRAVLICDASLAGSDVPTTARVLGAAINVLAQEEPVDLVVTGMASLDSMTSMLPGALAQVLNLPSLTLATTIKLAEDKVRVRRVADDRLDVLSAPLPALVSVTDQANEPRYPNFQAMAAARSKPLEVWTLSDISHSQLAIGLSNAETQTSGLEVTGLEPKTAPRTAQILPAGQEATLRLAKEILQASK